MPLDRVLWFQDPVVLVWEVQQAGGDALAAQGREGAQALGVDHAIIQSAVDDQSWHMPVLHVIARVVFAIAGAVRPRRAAVFPLGKPQLFSVIISHQLVEVTIVIDEGFEFAGKGLTVQPVDHIATVACAGCHDTLAIHPGVFLEGGG